MSVRDHLHLCVGGREGGSENGGNIFGELSRDLCTIMEKTSVSFSLGGKILKRYFDHQSCCPF